MRSVIVVVVVIAGWCSGADAVPWPIPSMREGQWEWAGLYGSGDGNAVVLTMGKKAGTRVDLGPGRRPVVSEVTVDAEGGLSDGSRLSDLARAITKPNMPLMARWVRVSHSDGIESQTVTVPMPIKVDDPFRAVMRAHQMDRLTLIREWMTLTDGDSRSVPAKDPLPTYQWCWTDDILTEVTWWSSDLVSTLDWQCSYTGGVHANTYLQGHTWRRSGQSWKQLTLDDYLGPVPDWRPRAIKAVVDDLVRQEAGWFKAGQITRRPEGDELLLVWSIAGDGLVISFPPYEVGPYCDGVHQVRLPWAVLGREGP